MVASMSHRPLSHHGTKASFGQRFVVRASRTGHHGRKANFKQKVGRKSIADHRVITISGKRLIVRVSRTTSNHGTKTNFGQQLVVRASRTTGHHGTKANLG